MTTDSSLRALRGFGALRCSANLESSILSFLCALEKENFIHLSTDLGDVSQKKGCNCTDEKSGAVVRVICWALPNEDKRARKAQSR